MNLNVSCKDKGLIKTASLAVADVVAAGIDASLGGAPLATGAWGLSKALLGRGMALRQKKALEWVEMVRDNPATFTKVLLETDEFQDAFVISLEGYIKERSEEKRVVLRMIFLDYSAFPDPVQYPLERFNEITKQISIFDAKNFSYLYGLQNGRGKGLSFQDTRHSIEYIESVLHLIYLGLLLQNDSRNAIVKESPMIITPYVYISELGEKYYTFIEAMGWTVLVGADK
jgi:hypothetical protein